VTDALVALIMALATLPAFAAHPVTGPYCATQLSQPPGRGPTTIVGTECFGNYAATIAFATNERPILPADFAPADMSNESLASRIGRILGSHERKPPVALPPLEGRERAEQPR
jgi:hypothetical protein